jgi:hypothetical protein
MMRIVIDIEGDQVNVHRVEGEELPPTDILAKAAALNAQSAGIAKFRQPDAVGESMTPVSPEQLVVGATDAGGGPAGPPKARRPSSSSTSATTKRTRKTK